MTLRVKAALNQIIRGHQAYSYTPCVWEIMQEADEDPADQGNVIAFYTGRPIPKTRRDTGGSDQDAWNREHIWSKSKGFPSRSQHAHTDAHHIRAADKSVNTDRSNNDFEDGGELRIVDTRKGADHEDVVHVPEEGAALPAAGAKVTAEIDWDRRHRMMRIHSCMHVLCSIVVGDVTGGQVGDGKGRLDFNLPDTQLDKEAITAELNRIIAEDHPLAARWITEQELGETPELIRTMSVKPPTGSGRVRLMEIPGVDLQPCGGTHVGRTGEIGRLRVGKIENKGRHNRRINIHFDE